MAGATINGSTGNQYIDAKIVWSSTPDNQANKSTVTAALYYKRNNTGFTTSGTGTFSITIDGTKTSVTKSLTITNSDWVKAVEATKTVDHNKDGTKSITISATGSISGTTLSSTSCSGTANLDTIPRASTIDYLSCATKYFTGKMTYKYTPQSTSYYNRCNVSLNMNGNYISVKSIVLGKKSASQQTATVTLSSSELETIYNELPSDTKGTLRFTFRTYSDSGYTTEVGDHSFKEIELYIPDDSTTKPSVSATLSPVSSLSGDFASLYIQGYSKVKASITATGKYKANVVSAKTTVVVEGKTYDSGDAYTSGYLTGYDSVPVKITVTDSRGYSNTVTKTISVIPYSKPKVIPATDEKSIICARCDSSGNLTDSGTYLKIKAKRSYDKCMSNGVQKNYCGLRYRYKLASESSYSSWKTILNNSKLDTEEVSTVQLDGKLLTTASYTVQVDAVDSLGNHTSATVNIPTEMIYMDRAGSRRSLGIGKYAEGDNVIDVADDITLLLGGNEAEAVVSTSKKDTSGSIKFASGLVMQWGNVIITPEAENTPTVVEVTYPIPYKYIPFVVVNPATTVPGTVVTGASAASVTATKFDATLTRANLTQTQIRWLAVGFCE